MGTVIVTWNVLHRVHADNWEEPAIAGWPDEGKRIASIAAWIAACDADVICLQEVSGDLLAALRDGVRGELFATRYPRVPAPRRAPTKLRDPAEYLVTIVRGAGAQLIAAEAFPTDGGKGFQRVELADGVTVIDTHVSFGDKAGAQLARLATEARAAPGLAIVCGDFNAAGADCLTHLGPDFVAAIPPHGRFTRPRTTPSTKPQDIDHLFARGGRVVATVLDGAGRSDHNPVLGTVV